jgi:hypothetical protein
MVKSGILDFSEGGEFCMIFGFVRDPSINKEGWLVSNAYFCNSNEGGI